MKKNASFIDRRRARARVRAAVAAAAGAITLGSLAAEADQLVFGCVLSDKQEVVPTGSTALGGGQFLIDTDANQVAYHIVFTGLLGAETAAHIHGLALHGANAAVVHVLPLGSPKVGAWNYPEAMEEAVLSGRCYVNVHTAMFPGGEVRGQVVPIVAPIDGRQEVPPRPTSGAGIALIGLDLTTDALSYDVRFAGLSGAETAAHIHGFAPPGVNAGVLHTLPLGNRKLGAWTFGAANKGQVLDGLTYVNVHSTPFPGGEIRGQLRGFPIPVSSDVAERVAASGAIFLARMAPNPLRGAGTVQFELAVPAPVRVELFDSQGRLVRDLGERDLGAGSHAVEWDGRDEGGRSVASGVYHYVLQTPAGRVSRPVSVLR